VYDWKNLISCSETPIIECVVLLFILQNECRYKTAQKSAKPSEKDEFV